MIAIIVLAVALIVLLVSAGAAVWFITRSGDADARAIGEGGEPITVRMLDGSTTRAYEGREAALQAVDEYLRTEQLGQAEVIIQALLERDPDDPQALDRLAEVLLSEERHEEALRVLNRIVELNPDDAQARFRAGLVANMVGEIETSIEHFRQASLVDRANPQYPLYLAQMYVKMQDLEEAKTRLLQAINLDPTLDKAWGTLAQVALLQNNPEMAEQHIARARQINPDYLLWKVEEAKVRRRLNDPRAAIELLQALPAAQRQEPIVVEQVALAWAMLGEPEKAAEEHVALLNRDPSQLASAIAAARFYVVAGKDAEALQWMHYAQRLAPEDREVQGLARMIAPEPEEPSSAGVDVGGDHDSGG